MDSVAVLDEPVSQKALDLRKEVTEYTEQAFSTIICEGDAIGAVIICNKDEKKKMNDTEGKLAAAAASFLGRQMEQ